MITVAVLSVMTVGDTCAISETLAPGQQCTLKSFQNSTANLSAVDSSDEVISGDDKDAELRASASLVVVGGWVVVKSGAGGGGDPKWPLKPLRPFLCEGVKDTAPTLRC